MLHYFNPGHEAAVLNASPYYIPPANVRHMQHDLAFLPAWYAEPGDQVLLPAPLDPAYARLLRQHFPTLPRPVTPAEVTSDTVAPWGISRQAIHYLHTIASQQKISLQLPTWHDAYRYLNSRTAAYDCLERLLGMLPNIDPALLPHPFEHLDDVQTFVRQSPHAWLAKAPYSSSGRGLLWLPRYGLPEKTIEVLRGILHKQGLVYVERVLDKVVDFSMQFVCDSAGHTRFVGYSHFTTNARGAYTGNYLHSQERIVHFLTSHIEPSLLEEVQQHLITFFNERCASFYHSPLGVDMLLYRDGGTYRLHPCLEINLRYNMGYLSLMLQRCHLAPEATGTFAIDYHATPGAAIQLHRHLLATHPPHIEDGRIASGYLPLCPVLQHTKYRAYVLVHAKDKFPF